jgi:peptidoglycan/xylan/chitin deacetylase (PgdA/CDA1 family)
VLELLAARRVRATFFVVGARAARHPGLLREVAAAGHELANHSWSHRSLWWCGPARTLTEVARTHDWLADLTGRPPRHFRPPWGMVNLALPSALRRVGERCVFWSLQPEGLRARPPGAQVGMVLRRVHPGAIIDLHDAEGLPGAPARLVAALPAILDGLGAAGWELVTVAELLDEA